MKNVLASIGAVTVFLYLCGAFGFGHFAYIYSGQPIDCKRHGATKDETP